jgi:hypothetical protein
MAGPNYLIGFGERLSRPVSLRMGGGSPRYPWTFEEARKRLRPQWRKVERDIAALPRHACPAEQSVISIVLHPGYLARSHYPVDLLRDLNLRPVGSRAKRIALSDSKKPASAPELFVAGNRAQIKSIADRLPNWKPAESTKDDLRKILDVTSLDETRLRPIAGDDEELALEIVLHASDSQPDNFILEGFRTYARDFDVNVDLDKRIHAGGLCFLPVRATRIALPRLTDYSFVRVIRRMPSLSLNESILRTSGLPGGFEVTLPTKPPLNTDMQVAMFDGGIAPTNTTLAPWVRSQDAPGVGVATPNFQAHGLAVTSALLFGPLEAGVEAQTPYSRVDHWRVLDRNIQDDDFELMHVLRRILDVLRQRPYDFVSLSIGPNLPIEDEEVHAWTSALDAYLSSANTVLVSACGNSGGDDWDSGNARIQPSSDAVNAVGVGAANTRGATWERAAYSSVGPGRSPGYIKPDLVAFGGCQEEPFWLLDHRRPNFSAARIGTSYAAPYAMRGGVGIRAHFGGQLGAAAIKALMVHHSMRDKHSQREVGWGRIPTDLSDLVICPDGEATIVYQGKLEPSQFIRFEIPVPRDPFKHRVKIKATFCIFTPVDPEDSLNYTRAGLGIFFRPSTTGSAGLNKKGKPRSVHPTDSFLRSGAYYPSELERRRDAHKWETILRDEREFEPGELSQPIFDIEHHARIHGQPGLRRTDISYALIVSLSSKEEPDLFNRILAAYPNHLQVLVPSIEVQVTNRRP